MNYLGFEIVKWSRSKAPYTLLRRVEYSSFVSTVKSTVHTNTSRKWSFSRKLFKPEKFQTLALRFSVDGKHFKKELVENDEAAIIKICSQCTGWQKQKKLLSAFDAWHLNGYKHSKQNKNWKPITLKSVSVILWKPFRAEPYFSVKPLHVFSFYFVLNVYVISLSEFSSNTTSDCCSFQDSLGYCERKTFDVFLVWTWLRFQSSPQCGCDLTEPGLKNGRLVHTS